MECINLKREFGRQYRVAYEESYYAEYGANARVEDAVYMILLCRYGHIYPFGGNTLAASVDGHPNVAGRLRRLECCQDHQYGDFGEVTVTFDVAHFNAVAAIMKPRRRRRLSTERRAAAIERLREYQPAKGQSVTDLARQRREPA